MLISSYDAVNYHNLLSNRALKYFARRKILPWLDHAIFLMYSSLFSQFWFLAGITLTFTFLSFSLYFSAIPVFLLLLFIYDHKCKAHLRIFPPQLYILPLPFIRKFWLFFVLATGWWAFGARTCPRNKWCINRGMYRFDDYFQYLFNNAYLQTVNFDLQHTCSAWEC